MRRAIPALLALALSLTACQSTTQTASPPVHPASSAAAPLETPAPTPSVAMTAGFKVSDVQEAEKVYREFYAAFLNVQRAGGAAELPPSLAQYLDKPATTVIAASLKADHDQGVRLVSREDGVVDVIPAEGRSAAGSIVALRSCADGRPLVFSRQDGATTKGKVTLNFLYFHRTAANRLVIFATQSTRDTTSCSR